MCWLESRLHLHVHHATAILSDESLASTQPSYPLGGPEGHLPLLPRAWSLCRRYIIHTSHAVSADTSVSSINHHSLFLTAMYHTTNYTVNVDLAAKTLVQECLLLRSEACPPGFCRHLPQYISHRTLFLTAMYHST